MNSRGAALGSRLADGIFGRRLQVWNESTRHARLRVDKFDCVPCRVRTQGTRSFSTIRAGWPAPARPRNFAVTSVDIGWSSIIAMKKDIASFANHNYLGRLAPLVINFFAPVSHILGRAPLTPDSTR